MIQFSESTLHLTLARAIAGQEGAAKAQLQKERTDGYVFKVLGEYDLACLSIFESAAVDPRELRDTASANLLRKDLYLPISGFLPDTSEGEQRKCLQSIISESPLVDVRCRRGWTHGSHAFCTTPEVGDHSVLLQIQIVPLSP